MLNSLQNLLKILKTAFSPGVQVDHVTIQKLPTNRATLKTLIQKENVVLTICLRC